MHCYHSCFYYCEFTFNCRLFNLFISFLILSCAFEHMEIFVHYKCFIIINIIKHEETIRIVIGFCKKERENYELRDLELGDCVCCITTHFRSSDPTLLYLFELVPNLILKAETLRLR